MARESKARPAHINLTNAPFASADSHLPGHGVWLDNLFSRSHLYMTFIFAFIVRAVACIELSGKAIEGCMQPAMLHIRTNLPARHVFLSPRTNDDTSWNLHFPSAFDYQLTVSHDVALYLSPLARHVAAGIDSGCTRSSGSPLRHPAPPLVGLPPDHAQRDGPRLGITPRPCQWRLRHHPAVVSSVAVSSA